MANDPIYSTEGAEKEKIDVRLSYRIVRLFSEGLYASPNKADSSISGAHGTWYRA